MEKVKVKLIGTDGNIFFLLGRCRQALKNAGQKNEAEEMTKKVTSCHSYEEALATLAEYVDIY